jgi:cardiolipin synthase A/B
VSAELIEKKTPPKISGPEQVRKWNWFWYLAIIAILFMGGMLFLALFEPGLPYLVSPPPGDPLNSEQYLHTLEALTSAQLSEGNRLEVLTDGRNYYPAQIEAIRQATRTIHLEAYIFLDGNLLDQFMPVLEERGRAGVKIRVIADAVGSHRLSRATRDRITAVGGKFAWYMPLKWYTWPRMNNRTHRELLIMDGKVGFVGGSGWADQWAEPKDDPEPWRDLMVRVDGPAVTGLQSVFSENWLEATGEVLTGEAVFPFVQPAGDSRTLVVRSSPTTGRGTTARVLFQSLLAAAKERIYITTPYFLPDASIRDELTRAIKERGVEVRILTPGPGTDHMLTRRSSRRLFGQLLEAGAHIYEYQPTMMHVKSLVIDSQWAVVGSTNMDPRSFTHNYEVNLATPDPRISKRLEEDFFRDLERSKKVDYEEWKNRGIAERIHEWFGALLERQQ